MKLNFYYNPLSCRVCSKKGDYKISCGRKHCAVCKHSSSCNEAMFKVKMEVFWLKLSIKVKKMNSN